MSDKATELEQCKYKPPYDAKPMRMLRHHIECDCLASRRSVLREIEDLFAIELIKRDERIDELESELNPDGLPVGLTISEDGELLNWRGENYVRQFGGTLTAEQVREAIMSVDRWEMPMGDTGLTNTHLIIRDDAWQAIADELNAELGSEINGETSDGYHTFNELYHHRAVLFSVIVRDHRELAWKARKHHDGTMYDGMFIVGIETPKGQATYHYDIDPYWSMFDCEEREFAPEWDGHTSDDAIARIAELGSECDKWKAKAEEAGRAMNAAAGLWAKADAENRELQAKCDELNAELGNRTCEPNWVLQGETQTQEFWRCECGNCGECFGVESRESFPFKVTIDKVDIPNYCPNCGAKAVKR